METLRTVPDSLRSGCSHVKMDLKSVLANSQNEPCLSKISACTKKLAFARVQKKTAIYTCYPQKTLEDHNARSEAKINTVILGKIDHVFNLKVKLKIWIKFLELLTNSMILIKIYTSHDSIGSSWAILSGLFFFDLSVVYLIRLNF